MRTADTHISDQDLLRAADGELPGREAARIQFHLVGCWTCRARRAELERTIEDFVTAHQREADGPRALLRARLRELEETDRPSLAEQCRRVFLRLRGPVFASLAAGAAVIIGLSVFSSVQSVRASSMPDSALTPGATRTSERDDVCSPSPREGFYPIPATLAYRVFEKYRIRNPKTY